MEKLNYKKVVAWVSLIICIVSLIPLFYVARYNHPTGDDIYYGLQAHLAWESTGSLWETLKAAAESVAKYYNEWQGTFSAMLIMHLQPTVFSEELYFLTSYLVLGSILTGSIYLWKQIARFILPEVTRVEEIGIWSIVMFLSIQWIPSIGEGLYWFNGAVYYSGFFGLLLWMFGLLCKYMNIGGIHRIVLAYFLAILIGGSNYITLLVSLILLALYSGYLLWKKHPKKWCVLGLFVVMGICLVISAAAPGNSVRQAMTNMSYPAYKAIMASLWTGLGLIDAWSDGWWWLATLMLLPFFISIIRRTTWKYQYPLLVIGFLYGLFCAMLCPTMYAQASTGPGRAVNLYRYGFVILSLIAVFYGLGWCIRQLESIQIDIDKIVYRFKGAGLLLIGGMLMAQLALSLNSQSFKEISVVKAVADIVSGSAERYDAEYAARMAVLKDESIQDVIFEPYVNQPNTVYVGDYSKDPNLETNQMLAKWYHKKSVYVNW